MPVLVYTARTLTGEVVEGKLRAEDEQSLRTRLSSRGLEVISSGAEESAQGAPRAGFSIDILPPVRRGELRWMTGQLGLMLRTGTTIAEALEALGQQTTKKGLRKVCDDLLTGVTAGSGLSAVLSEHPRVFNAFYVSAVRSGESSGSLGEVFQRLEEHLAKRERLSSRIRTALIYPMILLLISLVAVAVMMTYVVPKFIVIFDNFNAPLPMPTQILLGVAGFIGTYWFVWPLMAIALVAGGWAGMRQSLLRQRADEVLVRVPVLGELIKSVQSSALLRTLSMLLTAGVPIVESMEIGEQACTNTVFQKAVRKLTRGIVQGEGFSENFRRVPLFSPSVKQMISTGERSGALGEVMGSLADHLDEDIDRRFTRLSAWAEPLIIVAMGAVIGGMVIALLAPLFRLSSVVSGG